MLGPSGRRSNLGLAEQRFNRAFPASSSLSRLASLAFMPPYWVRQAMPRRLRDLQMPEHRVELRSTGQQLVALRELRDDLGPVSQTV